MLSISDECFAMLANEARDRGVNIQMLLRAVIIPEWTRLDPDSKVSTVNKTTGSGTGSGNTKVHAPVLPHITIAKSAWREADTYRSLYFRNIHRSTRICNLPSMTI